MGPLDRDSLPLLAESLDRLAEGFSSLPDAGGPPPDLAAWRAVLSDVAVRLRDNYPYFHPLYAGQMLKPPHPVARLAYALATWINPNNHALDGGRATSAMEKEAVRGLAAMFGWTDALGHLCGGGTMANLEALWAASRLSPGVVLASDQAHYTHSRLSGVLGLAFEPVACDRRGRLDPAALARRLERGGVGTVVATIGTTATGSVDPLPEILELRAQHGFRLHADAAYGGYFGLLGEGEGEGGLAPETRAAYDRLRETDSIVIDPHKHGLQPYGCGCVLFRDPSVGRLYQHDSPYTYFTSTELHLGEISLECSRPGASAAALWATMRLLPPVPGGEFARMLGAGRLAAIAIHGRLASSLRFVPGFTPELDIVVYAPRAPSVSASAARARAIFDEAARRGLHLALAELPAVFFDFEAHGVARDRDTATCLRSVLMKPEHELWADRIADLLEESAEAADRETRR
ncbi:MAG TPA: aminotransferase class I/II-fold pyridoxal phosphate-dependent enzyme [Thermoanaerobaculia bacterium]